MFAGCFRIVGLSALAVSAARAQTHNPQTEALLAKMRSVYRSVKTARFEVESTQSGRLYRVTVLYQAPTHVRVDVSSLSGAPPNVRRTFITDGTTIWAKSTGAQAGLHMPFNLDILERQLPINLESLCYFDWDRQLSTTPGKNMAKSVLAIQPNQSWNGRKWLVLQESAPDVKVLCHYYIDPKTYLMWRTTVRQFGKKEDAVDARVRKLELNVPIPAGTFKVPAGSARPTAPMIKA